VKKRSLVCGKLVAFPMATEEGRGPADAKEGKEKGGQKEVQERNSGLTTGEKKGKGCG